MGVRNTSQDWGSLAKALHWIIALMVLGLLGFGWYLERAREAEAIAFPRLVELFALHKSAGLVVLALVLGRLAWRLTNDTPLLPSDMRPIERFAAQATHWLLYAAMIVMPVSGYVVHSNFFISSKFFGMGTIPKWLEAGPESREAVLAAAQTVHGLVAWLLAAFILLHLSAALFHHFIRKDRILIRMLPFTGRD